MTKPTSSVTPRQRRMGVGAALVLLIVACLGRWLWSSRRAAEREFAAKAELVQLGALAVPGAPRQPFNSVESHQCNAGKIAGTVAIDDDILADTAATNAGIPTFALLRSLKIIDLSGTKVTGNFGPLYDLPDLNWLVVQRLSLDAEAIEPLANCPVLTHLTVREAAYPHLLCRRRR